MTPFEKEAIMRSLTPAIATLALALGTAAHANDIDPFGFEKDHFVTAKSRAEVVADLKAAQVAGQLPVAGEVGVRFVDVPSTKSRAQVVAETQEAQRLGLLTYGEAGPRDATPAEEQQIRMAGMRAVERTATATHAPTQAGG
jgi:hypothetical protein